MHAHTTLALSLSATLAYAQPGHYYNGTSNTTTTITSYVLPQETQTVHAAPSHASKNQHVADLHSQISSLKAQLSSQHEASATLCHAPAEMSAAAGGHKGNHGGAPGNPSATHEAANWSYFKTAHMSRLPATSTLSYPAATDCTSSIGGSQKYTGSPEPYPSKPVGYDGNPNAVKSSSAEVTEAPFPYSSYTNGTAIRYATGTGVTTSLSPTYIPKLEDYSIAEIESGDALKDVSHVAVQRLQERPQNGSCTFETARVRTEFRKMSNQDRKSFTDAITCLKQVPTTADGAAYPGVKSR
jgi:hypothetical protein